MSRRVEITILVENTARGAGLLGEHGFAVWVDAGQARVLFDAAAGAVLTRNAAVLGIDVCTADAVVLSHGHNDHSGGLRDLCAGAERARLFLHPDAVRTRFARQEGRLRSVGLRCLTPEQMAAHADRLVWTEGPTEVVPGIFVTGQIPRTIGWEDTGGSFYLDAAGTQADPVHDDQALYFDTGPGLVVLVGCCHAGLINTLEYVRALNNQRPIHAVLGGLHMLEASAERVARTIEALRGLKPNVVAPGHCTGAKALAALWAAFPGQVAECAAGVRFGFGG